MTFSYGAAIAFTIFALVLIGVQVAVVVGAHIGEFVWGGQNEGKLPRSLRLASLLSIPFYLLLIAIELSRAEVIHLFNPSFLKVAAWVVFGIMAVGTVMNLISRSEKERVFMTPLAMILAGTALVVALGV